MKMELRMLNVLLRVQSLSSASRRMRNWGYCHSELVSESFFKRTLVRENDAEMNSA